MSTVSSTGSASSSSASASYSGYTRGFNATELAQIAYEDRLSKADSLDTKITTNKTKISSYQSLQSLLQAVQVPLDSLRNSVKVTGDSSDAFLKRSATLTSSDSTSASSYLSATAKYGTSLGDHEIVVNQVAKAERLGSSEQSSSSDTMNLSGTFTLGTVSADDGSSDPSSAVITITDDMSLSDIADAINVSASATGVNASVVQTSGSEYMLVLTGAKTDRQITLNAGAGTDDVLVSLGVIDALGAKVDQLQAAQAAKLTIDGVSISRASNTIDDALSGITLDLYKPTVTTASSTTIDSGSGATVTSSSVTSNTLTLDVSNDISSIESEIDEFLSAYNSLRDFVLTNQSLNSNGTASDTAVLFGDSILRGVSSSVQSILSSNVNGVSLGSIGISFDINNYLVLDSEKLSNALANSYDSVQALFSYQMTSSSGSLMLLKSSDSLTSASFSLDVQVDGSGNLSSVSCNGDSSLFTVSGSSIKGATGSIYEGLSFVYVGKTSQTISVSVSAGIAERMYNSIDTYADSYSGQLASQISYLQEQDTDLSTRISAIQSDAEAYREFLLTKYSNIAAKLALAQTTLTMLEALSKSG